MSRKRTRTLFPKMRKILKKGELETLAEETSAEQTQLEEDGNARETIPGEVERADPL